MIVLRGSTRFLLGLGVVVAFSASASAQSLASILASYTTAGKTLSLLGTVNSAQPSNIPGSTSGTNGNGTNGTAPNDALWAGQGGDFSVKVKHAKNDVTFGFLGTDSAPTFKAIFSAKGDSANPQVYSNVHGGISQSFALSARTSQNISGLRMTGSDPVITAGGAPTDPTKFAILTPANVTTTSGTNLNSTTYTTSTNAFSSLVSDSVTSAASGKRHMLTYAITGSNGLEGYVLAWEDLRNGDWDYNDLVIELSQADGFTPLNPVPEPLTMALFGTGMIGVAATRVRRKLAKE